MRRRLPVIACLGLCLSAHCLWSQEPRTSPAPFAFFAFDNGTGRGKLPPADQAEMLAALGYDGLGYTGTSDIPAMLSALDARGLRMFSIYVAAQVAEDGASYDPQLAQAMGQLKGRDTLIWLTLQGGTPSSDELDEQAVGLLREIADLAAGNGLRVALYPHVGFYVAQTQDALRLVAKADRQNLGASLNLCHFLKLDQPENLEALLAAALPHLFVVSINGADGSQTNALSWDRLIQTLDRGDFDVAGLLRTLERRGYRGPVGLQCYQVPGDPLQNLARSMRAWQRMTRVSPAPQAARPAAFRFEPVGNTSLRLMDGDLPVLTYNYGPITGANVPLDDERRTRACYLHPVWGLEGERLTDDFPRDHYHHHGIFWSWPHVRIEDQEYDLWLGRGIQQRLIRWLRRETDEQAARLEVENGWFVGHARVMRETVAITVHAADANSRALDLEFAWTPADKPVTLWGAAGKSYGGLTMRFAPREDTQITVPAGRTAEDLLETPLAWADLSARFGGRAEFSGAALLVPPDHPDYPPTWLTRHYGALCVGWPGVTSKTLAPGRTTRARYRVWLHRGAASAEQLAEAYAEYAGAPAERSAP